MPDGAEKDQAKAIADAVYGPKADEEPAADDTGEEPFVKSGCRKVKVRAFFGAFKNAIFVEDETNTFGVCDNVDDETLKALTIDFPDAEVEITE